MLAVLRESSRAVRRCSFGLVGLAVGALILAACTNDGDSSDLQSSQPPASTPEVAEPVLEELEGDPDMAAAVDAYQQFIADRDRALMGDRDTLDRVLGVSSSFVAEDLTTEADRYEEMRDSAGLTVVVSTASSIGQATVLDDGTVRIRDCLEVRQVEDSGVIDPVQMVWQESRMALVEGQWVVDRFVVRHDGQTTSSERYGCVPETHRQRITDVASEFFSMFVEVERDASLAWPPEMESISAPDYFEALRAEVGVPPREREVGSPLQARIIGAVSDAQSNSYAWEVPVCLRYPDGKQWTWLDDGEVVVEEPYLPLSEVVVNILLVSELESGDFRDEVVGFGEPLVRSCWESGDSPTELSWG